MFLTGMQVLVALLASQRRFEAEFEQDDAEAEQDVVTDGGGHGIRTRLMLRAGGDLVL